MLTYSISTYAWCTYIMSALVWNIVASHFWNIKYLQYDLTCLPLLISRMQSLSWVHLGSPRTISSTSDNFRVSPTITNCCRRKSFINREPRGEWTRCCSILTTSYASWRMKQNICAIWSRWIIFFIYLMTYQICFTKIHNVFFQMLVIWSYLQTAFKVHLQYFNHVHRMTQFCYHCNNSYCRRSWGIIFIW